MGCYKHLSIDERESILLMSVEGVNLTDIGRKLGRSKSTISRELQRNGNKKRRYGAAAAQRKYEKRREKCQRNHLLFDQQIVDKVTELLQLFWSPEQMSQRLNLEENSVQISTSTIYRAIKSGILPLELKTKLRKRPYRQPKDGATGHLTIPHHISERPDEANRRLVVGHWESDTVWGSHRSGFIATHVDRKSRYLVSLKLPDISTQSYMEATIKAFKDLPANKRKTFTTDHGKEFAGHKRLTEELGATVYFADPGSPGQRGTNENTNGLLRQFFPKRARFTNIIQADINEACFLLNTRPRKCLGWLTPLEVFYSKSLHLT